ncbi:MAG TPA: hypothetical protein VIL20_18200 [Sandaracinaceae bacterium]
MDPLVLVRLFAAPISVPSFVMDRELTAERDRRMLASGGEARPEPTAA